MALGGIIVNEIQKVQLDGSIESYREENYMFREIKWSKVSNQKLLEYQKFSSILEEHFRLSGVHFRSLVLETAKFDFKKYQAGDKEQGFYTFYFQLLYNCFIKKLASNPRNKVIVKLDHRETHYKLDDLKNILNLRCKKEGLHPIVKAVQACDSKKSNILQLNDVILGAIGFNANGKQLNPNANYSKKELLKFILLMANVPDFRYSTQRLLQGGCIDNWRFQLSKVKEKKAP
jgi:hypothetical protein